MKEFIISNPKSYQISEDQNGDFNYIKVGGGDLATVYNLQPSESLTMDDLVNVAQIEGAHTITINCDRSITVKGGAIELMEEPHLTMSPSVNEPGISLNMSGELIFNMHTYNLNINRISDNGEYEIKVLSGKRFKNAIVADATLEGALSQAVALCRIDSQH